MGKGRSRISDLKDVMEYYNYSKNKAKDVLPLLKQEDLVFIREQLGKF